MLSGLFVFAEEATTNSRTERDTHRQFWRKESPVKTSGSQCQELSPNPAQTTNPQQPRFRRKKVFGRAFLVVGLSALLGAVTVLAAPFAKRIQFPQPDGTKITLWGEGDEFYALFETMDGYTVTFNPATKAYHYAAVAVDGSSLVPTGLQVGEGDPAARGLAKHVRIRPAAIKTNVPGSGTAAYTSTSAMLR